MAANSFVFRAFLVSFMPAVGLGAAVDYLQGLGMERVRAHERALSAYMLDRLAEVPGLRVVGPPEAERRGVREAVDRRHHRAEMFARGRVHPRGPPLRAAFDALPGRERDGAGERGGVQRAR